MTIRRAASKDQPAGDPVAEGPTRSDGTFAFDLPAGSYVVEASASGTACTPLRVTVPPSGSVSVVVECDTGVR